MHDRRNTEHRRRKEHRTAYIPASTDDNIRTKRPHRDPRLNKRHRNLQRKEKVRQSKTSLKPADPDGAKRESSFRDHTRFDLARRAKEQKFCVRTLYSYRFGDRQGRKEVSSGPTTGQRDP